MLLPMTGNIGQIIGPMLGTVLPYSLKSDADSLRWLFGRSSQLISRAVWS